MALESQMWHKQQLGYEVALRNAQWQIEGPFPEDRCGVELPAHPHHLSPVTCSIRKTLLNIPQVADFLPLGSMGHSYQGLHSTSGRLFSPPRAFLAGKWPNAFIPLLSSVSTLSVSDGGPLGHRRRELALGHTPDSHISSSGAL